MPCSYSHYNGWERSSQVGLINFSYLLIKLIDNSFHFWIDSFKASTLLMFLKMQLVEHLLFKSKAGASLPSFSKLLEGTEMMHSLSIQALVSSLCHNIVDLTTKGWKITTSASAPWIWYLICNFKILHNTITFFFYSGWCIRSVPRTGSRARRQRQLAKFQSRIVRRDNHGIVSCRISSLPTLVFGSLYSLTIL